METKVEGQVSLEPEKKTFKTLTIKIYKTLWEQFK